jgi:hypothetical protein
MAGRRWLNRWTVPVAASLTLRLLARIVDGSIEDQLARSVTSIRGQARVAAFPTNATASATHSQRGGCLYAVEPSRHWRGEVGEQVCWLAALINANTTAYMG